MKLLRPIRSWFAKQFPEPASKCGRGGMCHKQPDCSDAYCPGRAESSYLHLQLPEPDYSEAEPLPPHNVPALFGALAGLLPMFSPVIVAIGIAIWAIWFRN